MKTATEHLRKKFNIEFPKPLAYELGKEIPLHEVTIWMDEYREEELQRVKEQRDKLLKALNLSQQWIIKMNNCLPKSELKDILSAGIKSNEKAIKSTE